MTLALMLCFLICGYTVGYKINGASCPLPSSLKAKYDFNWKSKSGEWSNTEAKTSYLMLALSWYVY